MKIRTHPSFEEELKARKKGYKYIIGIDEVGRGAFAGPLLVGAVAFPFDKSLLTYGINDSKLLKPHKRSLLSKIIKDKALYFCIAQSSLKIINKVGIGKATQIAFRKVLNEALGKLNEKNVFVLIDGFYVPYIRGIGIKNQKAIIKGDQKSVSIAAASIIAKVHRDAIMKRLHKLYPEYKFTKNKGYGTKEHREAIKKFGLCKIHRKSFNIGHSL